MRADLHLHSHFSDGAYSPAELARRAAEAGVELFSLTDHDTAGGNGEASKAAAALGLRFVRGVEISAYEGGCKVHVLGYGCEEGEAYRAFEARRFEGARVRAAEMLARANAHFGLALTEADIEAYHVRKDAPIHTMHVVSAFAERLGMDRSALYDAAFARGGAAYSDACRPSPEEAIAVIRASGGLAVLAHPGRLLLLTEEEQAAYRAETGARPALLKRSAERRGALMDRLAACGLDGIECVYTTHTLEETEYFSDYARAHRLFATGGSDFHAEGRGRLVGFPFFEADAALSEALLSRRGSI